MDANDPASAPSTARLTLPVQVGLWLVLAAVGLGAWLWAMPRVDPDASRRPWPDEEALVRRATAEVQRLGLTAPDARRRIEARRDEEALDSLQRRLGRPAAVERVQDASFRLWHVRWRPSGGARGAPPSDEASVWLDDTGRLAGLRVSSVASDSLPRDDEALRRALAPTTASATAAAGPLPSDSVLRLWRFAPVASGDSAAASHGAALDTTRLWTTAQAERMALAHLARSAYGALAFRADSVRASRRPGVGAASVHLHTTGNAEPPRWADVEVAPNGALLGLDVRPQPRPPPDALVSWLQARGYAAFALFVVLALGLVVSFVRRLAMRQMDVRGSIRDGLLGALLSGLWFFLTSGLAILDTTASTLGGVFIVALNALVFGIVGGVVVTAASGVAEALSRPRFPEVFTPLALLRRGSLHDVRVGRAFLRGTSVGLAFLGGLALLLLVLPGARFVHGTDDAPFLHSVLVSVAGSVTAQALLLGFVVVLGGAVPLLAYALDRPREATRALVFAAAVVVVATLAAPFGDLSEPYGTVVALMLAAVVVWLVLRFDALTAVTALAVVLLLWGLRETWLVPGIPSFLDGMLAFGVVGVLLLVGAGGTLAAHEVTSEAALVPEYLREREREARDRRELEIARTVQMRFLPRRMPTLDGVEIAAACEPAQDVGGDLYDFIALDDGRVAIAIGDVSGKGIQAAFVMTLVKGFVQSLGREHASPRALLARLNTLFRANVPRGAFITLVYGVLDPAARTFTFSRAGHTPLVVRSRDGKTRLVQPPGAAIGLAPDAIFATALAEETLALDPGDTVVFYTDGFSEAMNPRHDLYGDDRLCRTIAGLDTKHPATLLAALIDDVRAFAGDAEQHDDMTAVVLQVAG